MFAVSSAPLETHTMNDYESRKADRIDRYRAKAEAASREAHSRANSTNIETLRGMMGEPVKVGHHSERRHRSLIERADRDMRASCEASAKAKYWEQRAEAAEKNRAVSADDPEALEKLREKLTGLEAIQERLKADNKALRKAKISPDDSEATEKMQAAGVSPQGITSLARLVRICRYHCEPYYKHPTYTLTNNNANIKRVRKRIEELERRAEIPAAAPIAGDGFVIKEDTEWGRILIEFNGKPNERARSYLKSFGWRWAPSRSAWVRRLSHDGRARAKWAAEELPKLLRG